MSHTFSVWRKQQNICPVILDDKEVYYLDIMNIEHSWSGRMDTNIGNTFIMEASQLLINAIEIFEQGYFDCAYYSLRSAIDVSTTMVFLTDMPEDERDNYLNAWRETKHFPMQGQMLKLLATHGDIFIDMKNKMPDFFRSIKELSQKINKYVHKQGLRHFYISRNHPVNVKEDKGQFISNFEYYLKKCIGVVSVMRLAFDPFPVLLMDKDILYRCFDSMTDPYSQDFVNKYIGEDIIEAYKLTSLYESTFDSFIDEPIKNEAVFDVVKYKYIDSKKMDEILSQISLMSENEVISALMVFGCEKIVKVYCIGGMLMYVTDRKTNRTELSWSGADFNDFSKSESKINQSYDEVYISVFEIGKEIYFAEHNVKLEDKDVSNMVSYIIGIIDDLQIKPE